MARNDPLTQGEAQAGPHPGRFGGKEGFKDVRLNLRGHPWPGIGDLQCDLGACRVTSRGERHLPWWWYVTQGLMGVGHEIYEHLLELMRIGLQGWEIRC